MTVLQIVGMVSMAIVAIFTFSAYRSGVNPRAALFEAWANLLAGFSMNLVANFVLLPLVGVHPSLESNFWLGWPYTVVSLLRQWVIRLWLGRWFHAASLRLAGAFGGSAR